MQHNFQWSKQKKIKILPLERKIHAIYNNNKTYSFDQVHSPMT